MIRRLRSLLYGFRTLFRFDNWFQLSVNRSLFPNRGLTVYALDGMEVLVDHSCGEQSSTRTCLVDGLYDPYFRAIGKQSGLTVLDLGANGGGFPLALQRFGNAIDKVVCVELNPRTHGRLVHNLSRNFSGQFETVRGAVDGAPGKFEVELGSGSVSDSIVEGLNLNRGKWQGGEKMETVRAWSLDELCDDQFDGGAPTLWQNGRRGSRVFDRPRFQRRNHRQNVLVPRRSSPGRGVGGGRIPSKPHRPRLFPSRNQRACA